MANLKGTKTEKNLMEAFADESMVRSKYTFFAAEAKKEGYDQVAEIFETAAINEQEHARVWYKLLSDGVFEKTAENLKTAIKGEKNEGAVKYKRMAKDAREEGFDNIAFLFETVSEIEKEHEESFMELLSNIEDNSLNKNTETSKWVCRICGYTTKDEEAPPQCPVCEHPKEYFERKSV